MSEPKCSASASSAWLPVSLRDAVEQAGAQEIDHDRHDDHREGPKRRLDRMALGADQAFAASKITNADRTNSSPVSISAVTLSTLPWP